MASLNSRMKILLNCINARKLSSAAENLAKVAIDASTGVATVSMHRPPVNSLNLEMLQTLGKSIDDLEKSKCRGMILTSEIPPVFSAGLDITEMYKPNADRVKQFWTTLQDTWLKLYSSSFPTVAVLNGASPAGGCLLAMSCEYRIVVGRKVTIGLNETQLGISAPKWFQDCMRNLIGPRQTELALTTGKMFNADEALRLGLVDELVENEAESATSTAAFFARFAKVPAMARTMTKLEVRRENIEWLKKNKEADLQAFLNYVTQPKVQLGLELYLQSLKKK